MNIKVVPLTEADIADFIADGHKDLVVMVDGLPYNSEDLFSSDGQYFLTEEERDEYDAECFNEYNDYVNDVRHTYYSNLI